MTKRLAQMAACAFVGWWVTDVTYRNAFADGMLAAQGLTPPTSIARWQRTAGGT